MKVTSLFSSAQRWLSQTPERALDEAYQCALKIKAIEEQHFNGQKVATTSPRYADSVMAYFQGEVDKYLTTIKIRLTEFELSNYLVQIIDSSTKITNSKSRYNGKKLNSHQEKIINQLNLIDEIYIRYKNNTAKNRLSDVNLNSNPDNQDENRNKLAIQPPQQKFQQVVDSKNMKDKNQQSFSDKTGILPRSILRTFSRIKQEIDPKSFEAEEQVINKFRKSRNKTAISLKFMLLLIIVPLLTHQFTKNFIVAPIVNQHLFTEESQQIFLNRDLEEEAIHELHRFQEEIELRSLIGLQSELSHEEVEAEIKHKAEIVVEEAKQKSKNAIENVIADLFSLLAFAGVIIYSKREIMALKSFLDEIVYGLSDSAKAFLIILFTDMFVGFHSPHGWEIILEGIAQHLGLPESREFNFLFIATFPVILDTVLKYWIFRYLNRISPSAVATYRNMNE